MALTDTLLASTDFSDIKEISVNINDDRILPYVRLAQRNELQDFLGEELYFVLLNDWNSVDIDFDTAKNNSLWDGSTYTPNTNTVFCHGLKLVLLHYSYARFIKEQSINITSYGVRVLSDGDLSEKEINEQIRTKANENRSIAIRYQREVERYLLDNQSDFPLFSSEDQKKMSFKMIKVG